MVDVFTKKKRSDVMSRIRGRDTRPENNLRNILDGRVFRYHPKGIFGNPDFANKRRKLAIFIDGCFWHGCPRCYKQPSQNRRFWIQKISNNKKRDKIVTKTLKKDGWRIIRIWEHNIGKKQMRYDNPIIRRLNKGIKCDCK